MPELPEVESAARELRAAVVGHRMIAVRLLHPALERRVTPAQLASLRGRRVESVERRGKHQLLHLDDGSVLHVHFRMAGDWAVLPDAGAELPRLTRAVLEFEGGRRIALVDPRMLGTLDVHAPGAMPDLGLGPEPYDAAFTGARLASALASRRIPIKPALLDQHVVAGIGNIYAAEALWEARIDPTIEGRVLPVSDLDRLVRAIRRVLDKGLPGRYANRRDGRFAVYDREGKPCRACRTPIERIVQAGRSTFYCPSCQGAALPRVAKSAKRIAKKSAKKVAKKTAKKAVKKTAKRTVKKGAKRPAAVSRAPRAARP